MIENNTNGTAMSFNKLIKIVPNGSIQFIVNELHPIELDSKAQMIPRTIPINIFQCKARFFIKKLFSYFSSIENLF